MKTSETNTKAVDLKLEVVVLPVADVERSKRFYGRLGWRLDADFAKGDDWHVVQMTPPGSATSVMFGKGLTQAAAGSVQGTFLVVDDIQAARASLLAADVNAGEVFHFTGGLSIYNKDARTAGPHPESKPYSSYFSFTDPDGNSFLVQEVKARLPGRGFSSLDVATLTELLREVEQAHGAYEKTAAKHHWSDWYAPYIVARQRGKTTEEAARDATLAMNSRQ
ncbi:MAG: VOC family protein [Myxococcota bacterium]|nr:VOC family protein [Myxococcota bacterium]